MNNCKICNSDNIRLAAHLYPKNGDECDALICKKCGFLWAHPLPMMDAAFLNQVYDENYTDAIRALEAGHTNQQILYEATMRQMDIVENVLGSQKGQALNIGAITLASRVLLDRQWDLTIVEVSEYAAQSAREHWGLPVIVGKIEEVYLSENKFDLVRLSHVIEHLEDPISVLNKLQRTLRPGGLLIVETDNAGGLKT